MNTRRAFLLGMLTMGLIALAATYGPYVFAYLYFGA